MALKCDYLKPYAIQAVVFIAGCLLLAGVSWADTETKASENKTYHRVVSLGPLITEVIYLFGAEGRLVGNTIYCTTPAVAKTMKKVGSVMTVNIEKIVSLNPDAVFASSITNRSQLKKMQTLGIDVIQFEYPKSFDEICRSALSIADMLGQGIKGRSMIAHLKKEVSTLQSKTAGLAKKRVFIQIGLSPMKTATIKSFINEYITFAGGINIAATKPNKLYSREQVLKEDPDVILIATMGTAKLSAEKIKQTWTRYPALKAVQNNQVHVLDPDTVCSPTPSTFVAELKKISRLLHPDRTF